MSLTETGAEYVVSAGKVSPPLAVTGAVAAGYSLQEWVMVVTILYTLAQLGVLIYSQFKKPK